MSGPSYGANETLLDLLRVLHENGTIDKGTYEILRNSALADEEQSLARTEGAAEKAAEQQVAVVQEKIEKLGWAEKIKLKGDLRTRYQYQDEDGAPDRGRGRLRYRLGVIAKPTAGWEVGAGLASGSDDQRSTNQSFDETFSSKGINLDYAYMQYEFGNGLKGIAGKFSWKHYLYAPTDMMWDSDINPEGLSLNYFGADAWGTFFANAGVWVLEENAGSSDDPYMAYAQLGQRWQSGDWSGTLAAAAYGFGDVNAPSDFTKSEGTNTSPDLSSFHLSGDLVHPLGSGAAKLMAEIVHNFETDSPEDTAWALGAAYDIGKWGFKYIYADVEANAVPDFLPDSDRFDGLTGIYAHEFAIDYALFAKVVLGLDYYHATDDATGVDQDLVQVDLNVKF